MARRALLIAALLQAQLLFLGCGEGSKADQSAADPGRQAERDRMVDRQIVARGIVQPAVIAAMRRVPRHLFVPDFFSGMAYTDGPVPIGYGQTISQPVVVAFMTEAVALRGDEKVLEIGTGSGYQAAVLAEIVPRVFTIEVIEALAKRAADTLATSGYKNVRVRAGDGYRGWPEEAPFDAIIVTAATDHVPRPLLEQLAFGGRLILPEGKSFQSLVLYRRTSAGYEREELLDVRFVPMTRGTEK
jgi:protein-L-isoaspartate(D-aspartate) O-methyltransferase